MGESAQVDEIWSEEDLYPSFGPETFYRMVNNLPADIELNSTQMAELGRLEQAIATGEWKGYKFEKVIPPDINENSIPPDFITYNILKPNADPAKPPEFSGTIGFDHTPYKAP